LLKYSVYVLFFSAAKKINVLCITVRFLYNKYCLTLFVSFNVNHENVNLKFTMQSPYRKLPVISRLMYLAFKADLPYRSRNVSIRFITTRKLYSIFSHFFLVLIITRFSCTLSQAGLVWQQGGEGWRPRGTKLQPRMLQSESATLNNLNCDT
jgi:hypothetical protein